MGHYFFDSSGLVKRYIWPQPCTFTVYARSWIYRRLSR
jgi:hypothetical protein